MPKHLKTIWIVYLTVIFATACVPPRPPKPPQPAPRPHDEILTVSGTDGTMPGDTTGILAPDDATGPYPSRQDNGHLAFTVQPNTKVGWGATLTVTAGGYAPFSGRAIIQATTGPMQLDGGGSTVTLTALPTVEPPVGRDRFGKEYQGNFGSIRFTEGGCGYNDMIFDPVVLLEAWASGNQHCFDLAMRAHADRGDNRIVVDPRAEYHDFYPVVDLWHDPSRFAEYVRAVRSWGKNNRGEQFDVLLFTAADGHIGSFIGGDGRVDESAENHWRQDIDGIWAAAGDQIAGVTPCWECRHQRDYMHPATYRMMLTKLRALSSSVWIGVHLISGSSAVSSWNCPDTSNPACNAEVDDPYQGSEPGFWESCRGDDICDGLLYQFHVGDMYLNPSAYPNYTGHSGALGRYWEIAVRLGNDPTSLASTHEPANGVAGDRHGWVQADLIAFEFIYDAFYHRSDESYGLDWCRQALAIGGWGCGSASIRR